MLAGSVVFKGLTAAELQPLLPASELLTPKPKELILSEGSPTDGLYVVFEGEVEVFLPERAASGAQRPSRVRLARLGPGRCVGEYGVIDDKPSSASVEAVTPAKLCFLSKAAFRRLVDRHDRVGDIVYPNLLRYLVILLSGKAEDVDILLSEEMR